jgi:hypothetical protein
MPSPGSIAGTKTYWPGPYGDWKEKWPKSGSYNAKMLPGIHLETPSME